MFGNKKDDEKVVSQHNTDEENDLLVKIDNAQTYAEGGKRGEIETAWSDEYKVYQGGGKQWDTTKGFRNERGKKRNFNSENNFVLPMIRNMLAPFSTAPTMEISGTEDGDKEAAQVLNDLIPNILYRNKFPEQYEKITEQFVSYGPAIAYVGWDQHWIGGKGPDRWVGEVKVEFVKKEEFFPDPAILDLEERLQECSYINVLKRKKLEWFAEVWPEKGKYVVEDTDNKPKGQENEGADPKQAALIIHYHKGVPKFVSKFWKEEFLKRAQQAEAESKLPYYARDLRDMAAGTLKGVHCAYKANDILLDYIPYIYDDGLYPFVYKVLYTDREQPYGMGEIRNTVIPQLLHNKADEIELGAMLGQGLGGGWYGKNAFSHTQKEEMLDNVAKANAWHEVNDVNAIKEKKASTVPPSITNYKNGKKDVIDLITGNTAILQGLSVGANVPYKTIAELGARADARTRHKATVLERFVIELVQLIINRVAQFYTVDRKYRILGDNQMARVREKAYKVLMDIAAMPAGTPPETQLQAMIDLLKFIKEQKEKPTSGTFKRQMLVRTWDRGAAAGGPSMMEEFIPDFDVRVRVTDDKPTDRDYWTNLATNLLGSRGLGIRSFWYVIENGKLPPIDDILAELDEMQKAQAEAQAQAAQTALQTQQQEKQADREYGVVKQQMQNESVERQVAMKAGVARG